MHFYQAKRVGSLLRQPQMRQMDRVERAAEDPEGTPGRHYRSTRRISDSTPLR